MHVIKIFTSGIHLFTYTLLEIYDQVKEEDLIFAPLSNNQW